MKNLFLIAAISLLNYVSFAQTVPAYIPTSGLLGWYPFSGNANNAYGTGKNGSVMGPMLTSDRFGNPNSAYYFNGNLDHIVIDTTFFNNGWSNYTISLWMNTDTIDNPNSINNDQQFINTIPHNGIGINMNWGHCNNYGFYINADPSVVGWSVLTHSQSDAPITVRTWNHIVFERKDDTAYSFYLNGVLDTTFISHVSVVNYFCKMNIGNIDSAFGDEGFWGKLDDYGLWDRTLSSCEVKRLFATNQYLFLATQPANDTANVGTTATFSVTTTGTGNTYQWQEKTGTAAFTNLSNGTPYSGVTTPTLTITPVTSGMTNRQYRCIINGGGACTDTSASGKLTVSTLSVNNVNNAPAIAVVPNPTTGNIAIMGVDHVDLAIYNIIGQQVKTTKQANQTSISDLPAGVYIIKLFTEHGMNIHTQRIIKQ